MTSVRQFDDDGVHGHRCHFIRLSTTVPRSHCSKKLYESVFPSRFPTKPSVKHLTSASFLADNSTKRSRGRPFSNPDVPVVTGASGSQYMLTPTTDAPTMEVSRPSDTTEGENGSSSLRLAEVSTRERRAGRSAKYSKMSIEGRSAYVVCLMVDSYR